MFNLELQLKKLLIKAPLLKSYIDWLKFVPTSSVNTGATDGKTVFYNPEGLAKKDELGQQFTLIHEILHVALNHMERGKEKDHKCFNYACDAVINQMIEQFGIPIPEASINCPDAADSTVEEYYDYIRNQPNYEEIMASLQDNPKTKESIEKHSLWGTSTEEDTKDDKKPKSIPKNENDFMKKNQEIKNEIEKEIMDDFKKVAEKAEKQTGNTEIKIGNIGESTSFLTWEDMLIYQKNKNKKKYDLFNGEFDEEGMFYYPYKKVKDKEAEVEIMIDTSGSVDKELVKMFLKEVKNIMKNAKIKIGFFDTEAYDFIEIKDEYDIDNLVIKGGGGTDFEVAVKAFQNPDSIKIVFTDGYASNPKSFCEAIWVVYSKQKITPPGGFVYNINHKDVLKQPKYK